MKQTFRLDTEELGHKDKYICDMAQENIQEEKIRVIDFGFNGDDELGLDTVSLVDKPAIEVEWVKFKKEQVKLSEVNTERRMVFGPALIPDQLILRSDANGQPYYARFKSAVIEKIAYKILGDSKHTGTNINHDPSQPVPGAFIAESWIKYSDQDKSNFMGFDLPIGTWFIGMKIEDEKVWKKIIDREVTGFSIEGIFAAITNQYMQLSKSDLDTLHDEIQLILSELDNGSF